MRRPIACVALLVLGACALAGCGQKGPLTRPTSSAAASAAAAPAAAGSVAAPDDADSNG